MTTPSDMTPTIYEWLGGIDALNRLTETFYEKVLRDPGLKTLFAGMDPQHPAHVPAWLAEVF